MTVPQRSREKILSHLRAATQTVAKAPGELAEAYSALPRTYTRRGQLTPEARINLMIERLREYDAEVVECTPAELPDAIAAQLTASGKLNFVAPPETPPAWMVTSAWKISGLEWNLDQGDTGQ